MADPSLDRDPVELLAEEFVERLRCGEYPSVEEYASAHPEKAEQIRELFPTIAAMEKLKSDKESLSGGRASLGATKLERLGDLRIIREIGRGGMGIVYEAEQESLGRRVAVKVLPKQSLLDDKHLRRFRREAKTAARLHHTNIVPILGVGEQDGYHYYVMQIIRGVGLDEIMPQLVAVANGTAADSSGVVSTDRNRAENVSSVARAMMAGDLRQMAHGDESSDLASSISRVSTPSTDSRGAAVTEIHSANHTSESATSFVLSEDLLAEDATAEEVSSEALVATNGRFSTAYWQSVARIGVQVANALQYAHRQGTTHRDIKPANLLIDGRGNMWVADFGLAKAVEQEDVSRTGDVVGTLRYMAPEQFYGEADAHSDIFSLGLTLYELLTLQPAYNELERKRSFIHESGPPEPIRPRRINGSIPRDMETIVLKAMAPEAKDRYETAAAMGEDLQRFLEDRPILARRASIPERLTRWARRNPAVAGLSAIAVSLLLAVAIVSTAAYVQTELARKEADAEREAAQKTSRVALGALDKIFERLAPHRYVSPEDFALTASEEEAIPVDAQPVLSEEAAALLTEMMKSYDELAQISGHNSELLKSVALANRRLGDIRARLGQTDQALKDYKKAIAAYERLGDEAYQDPKTIAAIASVHNEIGQVLRHIRSPEDWMANQRKAGNAFEKALELLQPLAVADSLPEVRYELARTYRLTARRFGGRGTGRKSGPLGPSGPKKGGPPKSGPPKSGGERAPDHRGLENLDRAVALLEELTRQHDVPDYKELLAVCYIDRERHRRRESVESQHDSTPKAIELLEELVDRYPQNPDYSFTLCRVYMATSEMGEPSERLQSIETALSILKRLHDEHPSVPEYLLTQTWVHHEAGRLKLQLGDYQQGTLHFDELRRIGDVLDAQSSSTRGGPSSFRRMRNAAFGFALARTLAEDEHDTTAIPPDLLIRARDELVSVESALAESPRTGELLKRLYGHQAIIYAALGDDAAQIAAQAKADKIPDSPWPPRGEGRGDGRGERQGRERKSG